MVTSVMSIARADAESATAAVTPIAVKAAAAPDILPKMPLMPGAGAGVGAWSARDRKLSICSINRSFIHYSVRVHPLCCVRRVPQAQQLFPTCKSMIWGMQFISQYCKARMLVQVCSPQAFAHRKRWLATRCKACASMRCLATRCKQPIAAKARLTRLTDFGCL